MKREIQRLVVLSDTHLGCQMALCPSGGVKLDGGGFYKPSKMQKFIWNCWEEFWNEFVPKVTKGEPFAVVHNGDVIDGSHHGSTSQITHNLQDQRAMALEVLKPIVSACEGRYYHIRGTSAHIGESGCDEESIAKSLGALPDAEGNHARWDLWLKINGQRIHFLHHVGTTASAAHEASAVNAELTAEFYQAARFGRVPPKMIVRSHRHANIRVSIPTYQGYASAVVTPAWQGKTPWVWKLAGARLSTPQFGGIFIGDSPTGLYDLPFVRTIEPSPDEVLCDEIPFKPEPNRHPKKKTV